VENDDPILARIDRHMAEGKVIMRENTRAFEDLRVFLGEMTVVLQGLARQVNQNSKEVREHRKESREQWQELREEMREERQETREQWQQTREELPREFQEEARALREEFRMQRAALIAILDQLRGEGPGPAPAT
jgi:DNA anti-recombination protein RmuC